jgi:hypothetical protein
LRWATNGFSRPEAIFSLRPLATTTKSHLQQQSLLIRRKIQGNRNGDLPEEITWCEWGSAGTPPNQAASPASSQNGIKTECPLPSVFRSCADQNGIQKC